MIKDAILSQYSEEFTLLPIPLDCGGMEYEREGVV